MKTRDELLKIVKKLKSEGKSVGFTSGVFDLLHPGHVAYLETARSKCDALIVAVNSDSSVKQIKGELRPVCDEAARLKVIEGLASVDYAFIFSEPNNNTNIDLLKPNFYFKAGDYKKEELTSTPIVEGHGGQVEIIPFVDGFSTTATIDKILGFYGMKMAVAYDEPPREKRPAIFLDRDGTICEHVEYLHEPEKFQFLPGALEGMKKLKEAGYYLIVVTNQPGIGLGYFSKEDFYRVSKEMLKGCGAAGVLIDKIYFSPFGKADNSPCRKPNTGMIDRAVAELNVDLTQSYVIGDMTSDIQFAKNAGCRSVLVETGAAGRDGLYEVTPDIQTANLLSATQSILK